MSGRVDLPWPSLGLSHIYKPSKRQTTDPGHEVMTGAHDSDGASFVLLSFFRFLRDQRNQLQFNCN